MTYKVTPKYRQFIQTKIIILQGRAGLDLLDSIEKEIYELSSEHRLMPSPDQLEDQPQLKYSEPLEVWVKMQIL